MYFHTKRSKSFDLRCIFTPIGGNSPETVLKLYFTGIDYDGSFRSYIHNGALNALGIFEGRDSVVGDVRELTNSRSAATQNIGSAGQLRSGKALAICT